MADYIIIGVIVIALAFAVWRIAKRRKEGGCSGCAGCSGCPGAQGCPSAKAESDDING